MPSYSYGLQQLARNRVKYVASRRFYKFSYINSFSPSIFTGNTCILEGVYDRGQGKGAGPVPVPAPLICFNPGERVQGDCPEKGAGYYMKNGFGSELFSKELASLK
jgi:hypothetical protein